MITVPPGGGRIVAPGPARSGSRDVDVATLKEQRIERIAAMMRSLAFRRGKTVKRLAEEWGLTLKYVQDLSAEASKRVMAEVADPEEVKRDMGVALRKVIDHGLRDPRANALDRKNVIEAAKVAADLSGAMKAKPVIEINLGSPADSPVLSAIWGPAVLPTAAPVQANADVIDVEPEPEPAPSRPDAVPADVDPDASIPPDGWR